ncbi:MAG TPA: hypothetical protein VGQ53_14060 [Chitinophagaceae bacterium]|nr:hypothetical protein [Chitinophagaceae bacterium]
MELNYLGLVRHNMKCNQGDTEGMKDHGVSPCNSLFSCASVVRASRKATARCSKVY